MAETVACPQCQRRLRLPDEFLGQVVRCPVCSTQFPAEVTLPSALPLAPTLPPADPPAAPRFVDREADELPRRSPRTARPAQLERRESETAKPHSKRFWIVISLLIGGMFLAMGAGVLGIVIALWQSRTPNAPIHVRIPENSEERTRQMKQAFGEMKPLAPEEIKRELAPVFDELGSALREANADRIMAQFDVDRMLEEFQAVSRLPLNHNRLAREFVFGMRRGLGIGLAKQSPLLQWKSSEIRKVNKLNDAEVVVIVRHAHPNGTLLKLRWWVTRRDRVWRIYDYENLDMGMRISSVAGPLAAQSLGHDPEIIEHFKTLSEAVQTVGLREDLDSADRLLAQIEHVKFPRQLNATRFFLKGVIHQRRGRLQESLDALNEAKRLQPDMPILDLMKGVTLNGLAKYEEALKHLQAYRDLLGEDANVCEAMGDALLGAGRLPEAADSYRKALDFAPKSAHVFYGFLQSLNGDDAKKDVGPRFAKLDNPRAHFDAFAVFCETSQLPQALEPLAATMRKIDPEYAPADYYLAWAKARLGNTEQAAALFQSALKKQPDAAKRQEYREGFLKAMAWGGKIAEAYAAISDAREAFRILAAEAMRRYHTNDLDRLVKLHRKKHADDPLLPLYQAEVYVREGRYTRADQTFAIALRKPPKAETLDLFRASRVLARYHAKDVLSAYREIGPRKDTFLQLASLCLAEENNKALQSLLDAHVKNEPGSADVLEYRMYLNIWQKQFEEGIALFKQVLAKMPTDEQRAAKVGSFLRDMANAGKPLEGYRAAPDADKAFRSLAEELVEQEDFKSLRQLIETHRQKRAADPWLAYYQGEIHLADKAWDKAAQAFAEGMKRASKDDRDSFRFKLVLARYRAGQSVKAYAEIEPRDQTFEQLANLLIGDKKGAELQALCDEHRPRSGDSPDFYFYEALAKVLTQKPLEACPLLRKAYEKQPQPFQRNGYVSRFVLAMDKAEQAMTAYHEALGKSVAFRTLAAQYVSSKKSKELAALLDEHGKNHNQDPFYLFYRGEWHLLRGEVTQAEPCFQSALSKAAQQDRWTFQGGWYRVRIKAGKAVETYKQMGASTELFEALADLCLQDKNVSQLQALLDAHRAANPDDANFPSWDLELKWLKHDYEGALRVLNEHREDTFDRPNYRWKADDRRVRCLVKLKRTAEAIREADKLLKQHYNRRVLLVLAHASTGDVSQTFASIEKSRSQPLWLWQCYQDDDLGPILRSEPFRGFREKYPEPKDDVEVH